MDVGGYRHNCKGFYKNPHTECILIGKERPQFKVPMQALQEFSPFFSLFLGEELQRGDPTSRVHVDTAKG